MKDTIKIIIFSLLIFMISACAALYDVGHSMPGVDRILHPQSKAEVGPVITLEGHIITGTEHAIRKKTDSEHTDSEHADPENTDPEKKVHNKTPTKAPIHSLEKEKEKEKQATLAQPKTKQAIQKKHIPLPYPNTKPYHVVNHHSLTGKVHLLDATGSLSPKGIIVRLNRVDSMPLKQSVTVSSPSQHTIYMKDKTYMPDNIIINVGEKLSFINKDNIQHNVFSSSGDNAFDLGTFGGELKRAVHLNKAGIVKVYCNIHPDMATYVVVDDVGISKIIQTDKGDFSFSGLPSADYILTFWSIRGQMTQKISLPLNQTNKTQALDIIFDTSDFVPAQKTNKFGKKYPSEQKTIYGDFF